MLDYPLVSPSSIGRRLRAVAYLSVLGLGASQAGALPPVQADPASTPLPVEGGSPGSEPPSAQDQQAPLADLNEVLEATRAKLEELNEAAGIMASSTRLREEVQALKDDNQRLTSELAQARTRQSELQSGRELADGRIAELTEAVEEARQESARRDEEIARLQRQNAQLNQSVERAHAAREAATARADRTQVEMTAKLEGATDAAARAKAELAAAKDQLGQAAGAAVEAERARRSATSEADALRGDAARARQELTAARAEIDRLQTANAGLEQQIASLHTEFRSATATARQNLVVMAEKIAALNAALESVRSEEATPPVSPRAEQHPAVDEPAAATPATSPPPGPTAPEPADDTEASGPADSGTDVATVEPNPAPAAVDDGLARFHADIQALNDLELSTAGADLFSGVESVSEREVHVGTTAAWNSLPPVGQQSYVDSLLDYWVAARGGEGPAVVRIVDRSGRVLVEKSTP
jgi:predicted  nucleic acid-binding Zn-ribbon protein